MKKRENHELLLDVARLLRKHGPDAFEDLATWLSSPRGADQLVEVLMSAADIERARGTVDSQYRKRSSPWRVALDDEEPEKIALLTLFFERLQAEAVLPRMIDVRRFVSDLALEPLAATSRKQAMPQLMRQLVALPTDELKVRLAEVTDASEGEAGLRGWSDVISGR
ncbi:MAG: hypothetical protein QF664_14230 [Dehalococcoidia bacterium]|nr:hypothetical protein [Dehalococcoidia bacterium]